MSTNENLPFYLFANCIPTKGSGRSCLYDLDRGCYYVVPNALVEMLEEYNGQTLDYIKRQYSQEAGNIIDEYFHFLKEMELIFFTKNPDFFPPIDMQWDNPSEIINCIIDLDGSSKLNCKNIIDQLNEVNCQHLQIRVFETEAMEVCEALTNASELATLTSIEWVIPFIETLKESDLVRLCERYNRITSIIVHSSPESICKNDLVYNVPIIFSDKQVISQHCCGIVSPDYFVTSIPAYSESLHHNSCLNRKISIDTKGNIKNCPSMAESYGNIKDTTFTQALTQAGFKHYWSITKDQISICKDCELRHICTDCRAYLEVPSDPCSKPLKCGYDPYTCIWEEWSTHPLKQLAISFYSPGKFF